MTMFNLFRKKDKYRYSKALASQLIDVIIRVKKNITNNSDMTYCHYETPTELIELLDKFIIEIENGNMEVIDDLAVDFAPTGNLQEHSISNSWSDQYLIITDEFDSIQRLIRK